MLGFQNEKNQHPNQLIWPVLSLYLWDPGCFEYLELILDGNLLKEKKTKRASKWEGKIWTSPASAVKRKTMQQLCIPLKYVSNNHPVFEGNAIPKTPWRDIH